MSMPNNKGGIMDKTKAELTRGGDASQGQTLNERAKSLQDGGQVIHCLTDASTDNITKAFPMTTWVESRALYGRGRGRGGRCLKV